MSEVVELYFEDSASKIDTLEARLREPAPNYGQVGARAPGPAMLQALLRALLSLARQHRAQCGIEVLDNGATVGVEHSSERMPSRSP